MLSQQLSEYISACFTGIWIESHEHEDALSEIGRLCNEQQWSLATWDVSSGLRIPGTTVEEESSASDPLAAIRRINSLATPEGTAILVLQNFHRFLQSAEIVQALVQQIVNGKQNRTFVIILAPVVQLPTEIEKLMIVIEHELPRYRMLRDRGMKHHAALRKLARSWIRILFRVWQTGTPFDCDRYLAQLKQRCPEIIPYLADGN